METLELMGQLNFYLKCSSFKIENNNLDLDSLELELIDYGLEEIVKDDDKNELLLYAIMILLEKFKKLENKNKSSILSLKESITIIKI